MDTNGQHVAAAIQFTPAVFGHPPPPSRGCGPWILIGLLLGCCCCGGGGVLSFFFVRWGGQIAGQEVADVVRDHPIVLDKLGGIDESTMNIIATAEEAVENTTVYDVRGPKGSGKLVVAEVDEEYISIVLRMDSEEFELLDEDPEVQGPLIVPEDAPR